MVPLQVPGGLELLIIGLIFLIFIAILGGIIGGIVYLSRRSRNKTSPEKRRIEELEQRVAELEATQDSPNESAETDDRDEK